MQLFAFGINHRTAPLAVRERVAFGPELLPDALRKAVEQAGAREAAIVSTCNRTELYCATAEPQRLVRWLAEFHRLKEQWLAPHLYELPAEAAVKHVFRVASGLDSMVLGEAQILGQMKQAVRSAAAAGTLGLMLNRLFQQTFSVAKEVRSHTDIGAASVSLAAAAVRLAERIFPAISGQKALFVGAGEMIELCATHFAAREPRALTFANRTPERAAELARRFGGTAQALSDLPDILAAHDIVVTSTASPLPIIGKGLVERALKERRRRPVLLIDLAVPRDVEPEVAELGDAFLYTIDDLGRVVQEGLGQRAASVVEAEAIINAGVEDFMHWVGQREAVPTIRALRDHAERARRHEIDRALRGLRRGESPEAVLEALSQALTNKLMHPPTHALHHAADHDREALSRMMERVYQLRRE